MGAPTKPAAMLRQAVALVRAAMAAAPPDQLVGTAAAAMAGLCAEVERAGGAAKVLYARRVAATGAFEASGHHDAAGWLASVSGDPVGRSRSDLETAEQVEKVPAVRRAFVAGELSGAQAAVIGRAAAANPAAADELLDTARRGSFRDVRELAARARRQVRSEMEEVARERRVHARRYCRVWRPDEGGLRLDAWVTKADGARLLATLDAATDAVFKEAWRAGDREPQERYRADALVRLGSPEGSRPGTHVLVRVDAAALTRGAVAGGEICEIAGVGPVPVTTARALLGDCFFNVLVTTGVDITTVTSTTRHVRRAIRVALIERDPTCVVPGCSASSHLQIDHWRQDFAKRGPTCLDNLCRLCARHHAMKTHRGWRLEGGPGRWRWVGPLRT